MEEWRPVHGYEGWYEVSSFGRCRAIRRPRRGGPRCFNEPYPLLLTPLVYRKGYLKIRLGECDGVKPVRRLFLHRMIYEAFYGPIPSGLTINHKNGITDDNRPENLETATHLDQAQHARRLGLVRWRSATGWRKASLTAVDVKQIRAQYRAGGITYDQLAATYGVAKGTIGHILMRRYWRHV